MAPPPRPGPYRAVAAAAAVAAALPWPAEADSWTTYGGLNCWDGDKGGIRVNEGDYDHYNPAHDDWERLEELGLDDCRDRCVAESLCQGILTIHRHVLPGEPEEGPCWLRKHLEPSECIADTPWDLHILNDRSSFSFYAVRSFSANAWLGAWSEAAGVPAWLLLLFIILVILLLCVLCFLCCLLFCAGGKAASSYDAAHLDVRGTSVRGASSSGKAAHLNVAHLNVGREDDETDTDTGRCRWLCCCWRRRTPGASSSSTRELTVDASASRTVTHVVRLGGAGGSLGVDAPGYGPMVVSQSHRATANSWDYGSRSTVVATGTTGYVDSGSRGLGQPFRPSYLNRY